jgi:hypothetical protein
MEGGWDELVAGRVALCKRRLGRVPRDVWDLTAAEIAEIGSGIPLVCPKRPRCSSPLPEADSGSPSGEDEAAVLLATPMRGVTHPPLAANAVPVPRPPTPPGELVELAPDGPDLPPAVAWFPVYADLEDAPPDAAPPPPDTASSGADSDPIDACPLSKHEEAGPEYQRWKAEVTATKIVTQRLGGTVRDFVIPVVESRRHYARQGTGSGRIPTRIREKQAADEAALRRQIHSQGPPISLLTKIGETGDDGRESIPAYDRRRLASYELPGRLDTEQLRKTWGAPGHYVLFKHSELTPPRRPLVGHPSVLLGVLPKAAATQQDRRVLGHLHARLPIRLPVVRVGDDGVHPGLAPVRGTELWVDSAAGRTLACIPNDAPTDFLVDAAGRVHGQIHCSLVLGQTLPKRENINSGQLKSAAERFYHNSVVGAFFSEPYGPARRVTLSVLLGAAEPMHKLLPRSARLAIIRSVAYSVSRSTYALKYWLGPPRRKPLSDRELMELQAVIDYERAVAGRSDDFWTNGWLRPADPSALGTAVHDYIGGKSYLQIGGMAASSSTSLSPLALPIKPPVQQARGLGDSVPQIYDGNGTQRFRYPPRETAGDIQTRAKQGTPSDQRSITTEQRIALCEEVLRSVRMTKAQKAEFFPLYDRLVRSSSQSNIDRWKLLKILGDLGRLGDQERVNQGSIRANGLRHAVNRNQWYTSEVFRVVTAGGDPCSVVYPRDEREVHAHHRLEFREWADRPLPSRRLVLRVERSGQRPFTLRSDSADGWGECRLTEEQRACVIWAYYWAASIRIKRHVRAQLSAQWFTGNVAGCVQTIDAQIDRLRSQIRGLSGLTQDSRRYLSR